MLKDLPLIVLSPTRFTIVGPGPSGPVPIIASSSEISDLVGYYSLREAGLGGILDRTAIGEKSSLISIQAIDLAVSKGDGERGVVFSLIFDHGPLGRIAFREVERFDGELKAHLARIAEAYFNQDVDKLLYFGQIISTFMSIVSDLSNSRKKRLEFMSGLSEKFLATLTLFILLAGLIASANFFIAK